MGIARMAAFPTSFFLLYACFINVRDLDYIIYKIADESSALTVEQHARMMAFMTKSGLPKSVRIFLRREKARLRREVSDVREAEKKIMELVGETMKRYIKEQKLTEGRHALPEKIPA